MLTPSSVLSRVFSSFAYPQSHQQPWQRDGKFLIQGEGLRKGVASATLGNCAGAVGNYNAAYPDVHWESVPEEFITSLGIGFNPYTTQLSFRHPQ